MEEGNLRWEGGARGGAYCCLAGRRRQDILHAERAQTAAAHGRLPNGLRLAAQPAGTHIRMLSIVKWFHWQSAGG